MLLVSITLLGFLSLLNAEQVPVLTFFNQAQSRPSIVGKIIGKGDFLGEIKDNLNQNLNLIVIDKLTTQDLTFSVRKLDLKSNVDLKPQVESPYETIKNYANNHNIKLNILEFENLEDALNAFNKLHQSSNVILTGKSSQSRSKRDTEKENELTNGNSTTYLYGDECAAYFDSIYFIDLANLQTSTYIPLKIENETYPFMCKNGSATQEFTVKFQKNDGILGASIVSLTLAFRKTNNSRYYVLDSSTVLLNDTKTLSLVYMGAPYGMETPVNYSFVCTKTAFKVQNTTDGKTNSKVWFYIENLQLQPTGVDRNETSYTFGPINYCQGFFSSGIWMAITASLILAFILAFGVSLLMNVKTMDRFDDPKGKPLNIGAEK
ncbi:unnamed protein product [Brachionus calyciflorus]|uniref:V-type proton ATPase subunit S1/VOA1 transmembrane domain-containing protein n=1 Tax=Brachionus calyciflorus TaxID=104777 RepID=A0A813SRV8_9BILA|nr:unnamed protein product [Brachionus calyciflorus]